MASPALGPATQKIVAATSKPVSFPIEAARVGFLILFAATPVVAVSVGLSPWMLALDLLFGLASIFFWAKLP